MKIPQAVHPASWRRTIIAAALAAATVLTFSSQAASARPQIARRAGNSSIKPVIVLVHGAWANASSWDGVIQRLQADGYTVYAPPNPLRGLSGFPPLTRSTCTTSSPEAPALAGKPIVLVGRSYGGAVITDAVDAPEVKALVFVDAFIPDQEETLGVSSPRCPGPASAANPPTSSTWCPTPGASR